MSQTYELVVITKGDLDESSHKKQIDEIKKLIEEGKGEVESIDECGKKQLAYTIKKQTHGHYTFFTFRADPKTPGDFNKKLRLMEDLLRYMVIRKEGKEAKAERPAASKEERKGKKK